MTKAREFIAHAINKFKFIDSESGTFRLNFAENFDEILKEIISWVIKVGENHPSVNGTTLRCCVDDIDLEDHLIVEEFIKNLQYDPNITSIDFFFAESYFPEQPDDRTFDIHTTTVDKILKFFNQVSHIELPTQSQNTSRRIT